MIVDGSEVDGYYRAEAYQGTDLEEKLDRDLEDQSSDEREVEIQPVDSQERDTE